MYIEFIEIWFEVIADLSRIFAYTIHFRETRFKKYIYIYFLDTNEIM